MPTSQLPKRLAAVVVMPGPVTGMTLATKWMVDRLSEDFDLQLYDLAGPGLTSKTKLRTMQKLYSTLKSYFWLVLGDGRSSDTVYLAANSGWGVAYNLAHTLLCRLTQKKVIIHHHVCSYSNQRSWLMAIIQRSLNEHDINLFLGAEQIEGMKRLYRIRATSIELPYGYMSDDRESNAVNPRTSRNNGQLVVGHLSNLTIDKGLETVCESVIRLVEEGFDMRLILAGPIRGQREQQVIDRARHKLGSRLEYRGPVYNDEKDRFFRSIDCFVFPSRYANEAQPIVLVEAMSFGLPLIVSDQGCISSLVEGSSSSVISRNTDPIEGCVYHLRKLASNTDNLAELSLCSQQAFAKLRQRSFLALEQLIRYLQNAQAPVTATHSIENSPCR